MPWSLVKVGFERIPKETANEQETGSLDDSERAAANMQGLCRVVAILLDTHRGRLLLPHQHASKTKHLGMVGTFWRSSMWYCGCSMAGPIRPSLSAIAHASVICAALHSEVPLQHAGRPLSALLHHLPGACLAPIKATLG